MIHMVKEVTYMGIFLCISMILIMLMMIFGMFYPIVGQSEFQETITVTKKELHIYDYSAFYIYDEENKYIAPQYLWNDIAIGTTYHVSGTRIPYATWTEYRIKSITEVKP